MNTTSFRAFSARPTTKVLRKRTRARGRRRDRRPALALWSVVVLLTLVGCSVPKSGTTATPPLPGVAHCPLGGIDADTIVIAATSTSAEPAPGLPDSVVKVLAEQGTRDDACLILALPDGARQALSLTPRRGNRPERGSGRERRQAETLTQISNDIANLAASQSELDVLEALRLAKAASGDARHIVLITSGISTTGLVDLRVVSSWDTASAVRIAEFVRRVRWVDLTGYQVDLVGIGDVAGAQPPPQPPAREQLAALWLRVCAAIGATCRDQGQVPGRGAPRATAPVSLVSPPTVDPYVELTGIAHFKRDLAQLAESADTVLHDLIAEVAGSALHLDITGHTDASTGTMQHNLDLSQRRAEAVRDRLLHLGLPAKNVGRVQGLGSAGFSVAEEQALPALIEAHRNVRITIVGGSALSG